MLSVPPFKTAGPLHTYAQLLPEGGSPKSETAMQSRITYQYGVAKTAS